MFNDQLDNLFAGDTGTVRTETSGARPAPEGYRPAEQIFTEGCPKCRGTRRFIGRNGRDLGQCFACKGVGSVSFKTSPETRAQQAASRQHRTERQHQETIAAFAAQYPAEWRWLEPAAARWNVAAEWYDALVRFGSLTEGKLEAIRKCIAKDEARAADRVQRVEQAPAADTAGIDRLKAAFDHAAAYAAAKAKGLRIKNPRITVGGVTISPAKATSSNPGALYVKAGQTYLGKIADGRFFASRECTAEDRTRVLAFVANPAEAAKVYGQETGTCCVCNAELKSEWRLRGIGPICAEKMGW